MAAAQFASEPLLWDGVYSTEGRPEEAIFGCVHVAWDRAKNAANVYEPSPQLGEPVLTFAFGGGDWEWKRNAFVIRGQTRRGGYDVWCELELRPAGADRLEPTLWRVELVDGETGDEIDTLDPVQVEELRGDEEWRTGIRLRSPSGGPTRKLFWEPKWEEPTYLDSEDDEVYEALLGDAENEDEEDNFPDDWDEDEEIEYVELGLESLNRFRFAFRALTKHRGEEIDVVATFLPSRYATAQAAIGRWRA